jgi:hypothetical protein
MEANKIGENEVLDNGKLLKGFLLTIILVWCGWEEEIEVYL